MALGVNLALPPTLIFKGENLNSGWILDVTPLQWYFSTSNKGWSPEPLTRRNDEKRRLLIIDGLSSHYKTRFLAFCIEKNIDLALPPPHTSHITQLLDTVCFSPLKPAITSEVDFFFRKTVSRAFYAQNGPRHISALGIGALSPRLSNPRLGKLVSIRSTQKLSFRRQTPLGRPYLQKTMIPASSMRYRGFLESDREIRRRRLFFSKTSSRRSSLAEY